MYKRDTRIFPAALQVFRLGLGQPAVNFPPLTAKLLYEKYTKHVEGDLVIYDPSSGWGGRILGAMSSNRKIHYIGTDPNPDNYDPINRYEYVGDFYQKHCGNKFFALFLFDASYALALANCPAYQVVACEAVTG